MTIPFIDLKTQYETYKDEIDAAMSEVVSSAYFIGGPVLARTEENLAAYCGVKHAIGVASGTDALLVALMALDLQAGDEVITTPFTFIATAEMVAFLGAVPVFVDIDEATYNINPELIEAKITEKTKAIIPVSLYGQVADMDAINQIAMKHGIPVIEDAAQSFGAEYKGKRSCALSKIATTSFFPAKPLGCFGDGGAVFTDDDDLARKIRSIMNHGQGERYMHQYIGFNGRFDAIQAAVVDVKLKHFDDEIAKRQTIAKRYDEGLKGHVVTPFVAENSLSVYAQYSIRVPNREAMMKHLGDANIPTAIHYPMPLYRQEAFLKYGVDPSQFPITEQVSKEIMSLPMSPFLKEEHQEHIINTIVGL